MSWSSASPQLRSPSEAVHGRSKAKRKTFNAPIISAEEITGQDWPKSFACCSSRNLVKLIITVVIY
jgi:hypothetical protein